MENKYMKFATTFLPKVTCSAKVIHNSIWLSFHKRKRLWWNFVGCSFEFQRSEGPYATSNLQKQQYNKPTHKLILRMVLEEVWIISIAELCLSLTHLGFSGHSRAIKAVYNTEKACSSGHNQYCSSSNVWISVLPHSFSVSRVVPGQTLQTQKHFLQAASQIPPQLFKNSWLMVMCLPWWQDGSGISILSTDLWKPQRAAEPGAVPHKASAGWDGWDWKSRTAVSAQPWGQLSQLAVTCSSETNSVFSQRALQTATL